MLMSNQNSRWLDHQFQGIQQCVCNSMDEVITGVYQAKGDIFRGLEINLDVWPHVSRKADGVPNRIHHHHHYRWVDL